MASPSASAAMSPAIEVNREMLSSYFAMKSIDNADLARLRFYHGASENMQAALLDADGLAYMRVSFDVVRDVREEATLEYALAIIHDKLLLANPERATWFHCPELENEDVYLPFSRLMSRNYNWIIEEKASRILTLTIRFSPRDVDSTKTQHLQGAIRCVVSWLCSQLRYPSHPTSGIPTAVSCLVALLRTAHSEMIRRLFLQLDGIKLIAPVISPPSSSQSVQVLYEATMCMWMLSYHDDAVMKIQNTRAVPCLVEVIRTSSKEKVIRVAALTLKNLVTRKNLAADMMEAGLLEAIHNLRYRLSWSDEELTEAFDELEATLKDTVNLKASMIRSFEKYKQELLSGNPDWTPMHKDPLFWKEHIHKFEENDFQIVHRLVDVLNNSRYPKSLAVACHDLSCFIEKHPHGRNILQRLGIRKRLLELIDHEDLDVSGEAVLCVQRIFLNSKWVAFLRTLTKNRNQHKA